MARIIIRDDRGVPREFFNGKVHPSETVCRNDDARGIAQRLAKDVVNTIKEREVVRYMKHSPNANHFVNDIIEALIDELERKL